MNIIDKIEFQDSGPKVLKIHQSERTKIFAVALKEGQMLKKHKANVPSFLTVLKGAIRFELPDSSLILDEFDTFNIPVSIEHEVIAQERSVFMITQEIS